jgi:hypothetical protein
MKPRRRFRSAFVAQSRLLDAILADSCVHQSLSGLQAWRSSTRACQIHREIRALRVLKICGSTVQISSSAIEPTIRFPLPSGMTKRVRIARNSHRPAQLRCANQDSHAREILRRYLNLALACHNAEYYSLRYGLFDCGCGIRTSLSSLACWVIGNGFKQP